MAKPQPIYQVDAFTDKPFAGNPAGVCVLEQPRDDAWMQSVAREMNVSETAFLNRFADGYNLRWFTPTVEVELCGHATLASAHSLWEMGYLKPDTPARFYTKSGQLTCTRKDGAWIEMDFPAKREQRADPPPGLLDALGVQTPLYVGKNQFDYLVEVDAEDGVRGLKPNFGALAGVKARGVMVTSRAATAPYDFVSRFFAPAAGIDEDPATGSAHCCLGPYWGERIRKTEFVRKTEFLAYQASSRGGIIKVRLDERTPDQRKGGEERVFLGGQAVTVLHAKLYT